MKRVYLAGSYSADNVISILDNIRKGIRAGTEVLLAGYAPFTPWLDYHYNLSLRDGEKLTVEDFYRYSLSWLEVSEAVLVLPDSENSNGTRQEIEAAKKLGIPIFYSLEELKKFFDN